MRMIAAPFVLVALMTGSAGTAHAANVSSFDPQSMVAALQSAGYRASLTLDKDGDSLVETASDGNDITVVLTDCQDHKSCSTAEFVGVWNCESSIELCKKAALDTNNEESPAKVKVADDGKRAFVYQYLIFDEIGISEKLLSKT